MQAKRISISEFSRKKEIKLGRNEIFPRKNYLAITQGTTDRFMFSLFNRLILLFNMVAK